MPSTEKKRARDRRSQQSLRDRKQKRIAELEELVAQCRESHPACGAHGACAGEIAALRHQNSSLLQRQELLKSLVLSWSETDLGVAPDHRWTTATVLPLTGASGMCTAAPVTGVATCTGDTPGGHNEPQSQGKSTVNDHPPELFVASSETTPPPPPSWSFIPPCDDDFTNIETVAGCHWFKYAELIKTCPDTPHSPLDLLYGSKLNPLADIIHSNSNRRPFREPERLATGWIAYLFTRWVCNPCPGTYERMPSFLRPVREQLEITHPMVLNLVPWPRVRIALIRAWPKYRDDYRDFFELFACCIRIRWPWGDSILERALDNTLVMRSEFFKTMMSESGWTVTRDFVDKHPALFADIHVDSILYKFV